MDTTENTNVITEGTSVITENTAEEPMKRAFFVTFKPKVLRVQWLVYAKSREEAEELAYQQPIEDFREQLEFEADQASPEVRETGILTRRAVKRYCDSGRILVQGEPSSQQDDG